MAQCSVNIHCYHHITKKIENIKKYESLAQINITAKKYDTRFDSCRFTK
jgi:hypothetical protein